MKGKWGVACTQAKMIRNSIDTQEDDLFGYKGRDSRHS